MTETKFIDAPDGLALAFAEAGAGPPVVLVHGLGLSSRRWAAQIDALTSAGFRCVRFDLRGFGESQKPHDSFGMDTLVSDLAVVIEKLGPPPVHLVGHSLGGMIAMQFAIDRPHDVSSLAVMSSSAHCGTRASAFAAGMGLVAELGFDGAMANPGLVAMAEAALTAAFPNGGAPPLDSFRRWFPKPNPVLANAWRATQGFSVRDQIAAIGCPVLVVHGTADLLIPFPLGRWIHNSLPGSRFVELQGAGHSIQVERAAEVNAALVEFLASVR